MARIEAVVRRHRRGRAREDAGPLIAGELEIRADRFQVYVAGESLDLTRREFELLQVLADHAGKVLERDEIYRRVWGYAMIHGDRSVDVFVRKLRSKLQRRSPGWEYIHTHFGIGYRFDPQPLGAAEDEPAVEKVSKQAAETRARARADSAGRSALTTSQYPACPRPGRAESSISALAGLHDLLTGRPRAGNRRPGGALERSRRQPTKETQPSDFSQVDTCRCLLRSARARRCRMRLEQQQLDQRIERLVQWPHHRAPAARSSPR